MQSDAEIKRQSMLEITEFLPYQLVQLANKVSDDFSNVYKEEADLTTPQWRVMAHLAQNQFSAKQLCDLARIDKSTMSRAIRQLGERGLIKLKQDEEDKRSKVLNLTDEGLSTYKRISVLAREWENELLSSLTQEEQALFRSILEKLNLSI